MKPFRERRLLQVLCLLYLVAWTLGAIKPVSRSDWMLENLLVFVAVGFFVIQYRWRPLSDSTYILLFLFMLLHAIGAHYTYAKVPLGFWLQSWFHLSRNHYDRIIHFGFGLLLTVPLAELLRVENLRPFWRLFLPVSLVVGWSGSFEIVEAIVAWIASPELGQEYLGTQGDQWDAQKDMALATLGALLSAPFILRNQYEPASRRVRRP